jgi:aldehyde:ferredoxin oxidoreductase
MSGITGKTYDDNLLQAGERIYNLEKLFNYREGFTRADDVIPDRFFEEPLTVGEKKGAVLTRDQFKTMMDDFYTKRGWDLKTSKPGAAKLKSLKLPV